MKHVFFVLILMVVFNSGAALALTAEEVKTKLSELDLGIPLESVSPGSIDQFYRVVLSDGSVLHATHDGNYFIYGDMYRVAGDKIYNYDEEKRNERRRVILASMAESEAIIFAAPQTRLRRQLLYLLISTADSVENSTSRCQR